MPTSVIGVLFHQFCRVQQENTGNLQRGFSAEDCSLKTFPNQPGQIPAVIEMRVRQQYGVEFGHVRGYGSPIAQTQSFQTLKKAAIHQHATTAFFQQIAGTRDRPGGTKKGDPHGSIVVRKDSLRITCDVLAREIPYTGQTACYYPSIHMTTAWHTLDAATVASRVSSEMAAAAKSGAGR